MAVGIPAAGGGRPQRPGVGDRGVAGREPGTAALGRAAGGVAAGRPRQGGPRLPGTGPGAARRASHRVVPGRDRRVRVPHPRGAAGSGGFRRAAAVVVGPDAATRSETDREQCRDGGRGDEGIRPRHGRRGRLSLGSRPWQRAVDRVGTGGAGRRQGSAGAAARQVGPGGPQAAGRRAGVPGARRERADDRGRGAAAGRAAPRRRGPGGRGPADAGRRGDRARMAR